MGSPFFCKYFSLLKSTIWKGIWNRYFRNTFYVYASHFQEKVFQDSAPDISTIATNHKKVLKKINVSHLSCDLYLLSKYEFFVISWKTFSSFLSLLCRWIFKLSFLFLFLLIIIIKFHSSFKSTTNCDSAHFTLHKILVFFY